MHYIAKKLKNEKAAYDMLQAIENECKIMEVRRLLYNKENVNDLV